jgi:hypothetical protein
MKCRVVGRVSCRGRNVSAALSGEPIFPKSVVAVVIRSGDPAQVIVEPYGDTQIAPPSRRRYRGLTSLIPRVVWAEHAWSASGPSSVWTGWPRRAPSPRSPGTSWSPARRPARQAGCRPPTSPARRSSRGTSSPEDVDDGHSPGVRDVSGGGDDGRQQVAGDHHQHHHVADDRYHGCR